MVLPDDHFVRLRGYEEGWTVVRKLCRDIFVFNYVVCFLEVIFFLKIVHSSQMFSPPVSHTTQFGRPSAVLCVVYSGTPSISGCSIRVFCVEFVYVLLE